MNPTLVLNETFAAPPDGKVYGIHSATQGFVRAYMAHAQPGELRFRTDRDEVRAALREDAARAAIPLAEVGSLDDVDRCAMFYALPQPDAFWLRRRAGAARYAICGIHHSLTGHDIYAQMRDLALAPTEPWDALVCTSRAAKGAVQRLLEGWSDHLSSRGGSLPEPRLQLPVIPLGIDTGEFRSLERDRPPAGLRARLGIPPDALAVLFLGRLNFSSKAHPFPMFSALERARHELGQPIHLIQAGWFPSQAVADATAALAHEVAPSVIHHQTGAVSGAGRAEAYAAADLFMSLAENVQETFGLTLVEAMASGLPVVATDWDGYRDTVDSGVSGFLVPTIMAPAGAGRDIGAAFGFGGRPYNRYLMDAAQATSVDVDAAVRAVVALGRDRDLRRRMGEAGRRRAEAIFDWRVVVAAYGELWDDLDRRRIAARVPTGPTVDDPIHPDPFRVFAGFASRALGADASFLVRPDGDARLRVALGSAILKAPSDLLLDDNGLEQLVRSLQARTTTTMAEVGDRSGDPGGRLLRSLMWLAKVGVIEIV